MPTLLDNLKEYFSSKSAAEIRQDWDEYAIYDEVGPSMYGVIMAHSPYAMLLKASHSPDVGEASSQINVIQTPDLTPEFLF